MRGFFSAISQVLETQMHQVITPKPIMSSRQHRKKKNFKGTVTSLMENLESARKKSRL
jgi:hypothetical protein